MRDRRRCTGGIGQHAAIEAQAVGVNADAVVVVVTLLDDVVKQKRVAARAREVTGLHRCAADVERQRGGSIVGGCVGVHLGDGAIGGFHDAAADVDDFAQGDGDEDFIARIEGVVLDAVGPADSDLVDAGCGAAAVSCFGFGKATEQAAAQQPGQHGEAPVARLLQFAKVLVLRNRGVCFNCNRRRFTRHQLHGQRRILHGLSRSRHGGIGRGHRRCVGHSEFAAGVEQGRDQHHLMVLELNHQLRVGQGAQTGLAQHDLLTRMQDDDDVKARLVHAFHIGRIDCNLERMYGRQVLLGSLGVFVV